MNVDDIVRWARGKGLEAVLLGLGSVLAARFVHWMTHRVMNELQQRVRTQLDAGLVPSERSKQMQALVQAIEWTLVVTVYFLAGLLILLRFNLPLTGLVAPATVAGVAIGFGAQRLVADLLSGFFLFAERQYGFGDVIEIAAVGATTGISGTVEELTLRTTKLRTVKGELVMIPNGEIRQVTNLSRDWSRVVIDLPLPLDEDVERAADLLRQAGAEMASDPRWQALLLEPPVVVGVENIEVSYLQLRLVARTLPAKQWEVGRELRRRAAVAFRNAGLVAPKALQ